MPILIFHKQPENSSSALLQYFIFILKKISSKHLESRAHKSYNYSKAHRHIPVLETNYSFSKILTWIKKIYG